MVAAIIYIVIFLAHVLFGLPAIDHYGLLLYAVLGTALWSVSHRRRVVWILLAVLFFVLPFIGTLILGYVTAANTYVESPAGHEQVESVKNAALRPLLIHISDSHVLAPNEARTWEGAKRDAVTLSRLVSQILRIRPRYLVITGDTTDSGKDSEWTTANALMLQPARRAGIIVIMAPGNHDLQPAFRGVAGAGSAEFAGAVLVRRYLEAQNAMSEDLVSVDRGSLTSLVSWRPSERMVSEEASKAFQNCVSAGIGQESGTAWIIGCGMATTPEKIKEHLVTFRTERARLDWFPLVRYDEEGQTYVVVLCSIGMRTSSIGDNAVGLFGTGQLRRLDASLGKIPANVKHVFILVHHPLLRKWEDKLTLPRRWWRYGDWTENPLYNAALLKTEWHEASMVIDSVRKAMDGHPGATFAVLYGHEHRRLVSSVGMGSRALLVSEAPAFGEGSDLGFRAIYVGKDGALNPVWLRF